MMPEILSYLLAITIFLYALQSLILLYGTTRLNYSTSNSQPSVSIIIAARDEEKNLAACLSSLTKVKYPRQKLELIVVNDRSKDRTGQIISEYAKRFENFKSITVQQGLQRLSGKASAISQGIEQSSGEVILLTDADCQVPRSWVEEFVTYFDDDVGLVGGFTLLDRPGNDTPGFGKIQSLDWAYLLSVAAGSAGLGIPLSWIGNNFAFRREAYEEVGGYQGVGFSVAEDFALLKSICQETHWQLRFPITVESLVYSKPMTSWREFYHQRKRWGIGGKQVRFFGKLLMILAFTTHLIIPIAFSTVKNLAFPFLATAVIFFSDFLLLLRTTRRLRRMDLLKYFPLFELFYFLYTTIFAGVILFTERIKWKGITYNSG